MGILEAPLPKVQRKDEVEIERHRKWIGCEIEEGLRAGFIVDIEKYNKKSIDRASHPLIKQLRDRYQAYLREAKEDADQAMDSLSSLMLMVKMLTVIYDSEQTEADDCKKIERHLKWIESWGPELAIAMTPYLGVKVNDIARSWLQKVRQGTKKMESSQAASGSERDTELSSEKRKTM